MSVSAEYSFVAAGFSAAKWDVLRDALAKHLLTASLDIIDPTSQYGEKRIYRCNLMSPNERDPCVLTVWQQTGDGFRLITAYPFQA